ncbi:DUF7380 domain-containing protein [Allofranklinella schreckenbergeri]
MNNERYPQDLTVSLQDFKASGWREAIAQATREGYSAMWQALSAAARSAIEQGRFEHGKVLERVMNFEPTESTAWHWAA